MKKYCSHCLTELINMEEECPACGCDNCKSVPAHHLLPGTILNGKFYVGEALGEGGFGITYIGRDLNLDMKVAIKEFYPSGYVNRNNTLSQQINDSITEGRKDFFEKGRERFLKEAQILAKFSGEAGIVDVRDFFEENNTAYIIMEYLEGVNLKTYLKKNGKLVPKEAIRLLTPIMNSLKKVHSQGLIHRDISPDNIIIIGDKIKLIDFGAARTVSASANKSLSIMLKPGYAPEEQYRSKGNQGPWTDIYALCALIYKCITGITPDDSTQRVFSDEVKTPSALGIEIKPEIEKAIMKGMSVHQKDRYQCIEDLFRGLQGIEVALTGTDRTIAAVNGVCTDDVETMYIPIDSGDSTIMNKEPEDDVTIMGKEPEDDVTIMGKEPEDDVTIMGKEPEDDVTIMGKEPEDDATIMGKEPEDDATIIGDKAEGVLEKDSKKEQHQNLKDKNVVVSQEKEKAENTPKAKFRVLFISIIIAVVCIVLIVLLLSLKGCHSNKSENNVESAVNNIVKNEEEIAANITTELVYEPVDVEMSDELFDYTFELDGDVYKLPCRYEDFAQNGWTIASTNYSEDNMIDSDSYDYYRISKDGRSLTIYFYNLDESSKTVKNCKIGGISCETDSVGNFTLAKNIGVHSDAKDIKNAYGTPDSDTISDNCESIEYYEKKTNSSHNYAEFICRKSSDKSEMEITLFNFAEDELNDSTKNSNDDKLTLSDDLFDYTFELEGVLYKLPCKYEDFTSNGWTISSSNFNSDTNINGYSYEDFNMSKNGHQISLYVYNYSGNAKALKDCKIGGISCLAKYVDDLIIAKGINIRSGLEEFISLFGEPQFSYEGSSFDSITYYEKKNSSYNSVEIYGCDNSDDNKIKILNFVEEDDDKTETITEKPDYLNEYKAPVAMGSDLKSSVIKIEGDLYQFPAPFSEFTDNGWTVIQQNGNFAAGQTDSVRVEKNGKKLSLHIANYADYQTTIDNCVVYQVFVDNESDVSVLLGSETIPVSIGTSKSAVDSIVCDDFKFSETARYYQYSYSEYDERDFNITIKVDKETEKVSSVYFYCKTWEY